VLFSAPIFLFVFLPLTLAAWFLFRRHKAVLLAASLLFYSWGEPVYIWLLLFVIGFNYAMGERLRSSPTWARSVFILAMTVNIALLLTFKYATFLAENLNALLLRLQLGPVPVPHFGLPLGISFFTFQGLAYLIDIHRGQVEPAGSLYRFALFKSFFPQLIAGPIVRYQQVAEDFAADRSSAALFAQGVSRFAVGLAKKVIIADNLAPAVDAIFMIPSNHIGVATAWMGSLCFTLQIYFDFCGYSDMAIGLGNMFGIHLPENFRYPYAASSVKDFWRRWHISLSTWFRDYLYLPLGGNRRGPSRTYLNLALVFALCGLWHGAAWTFLAWGLYHGCFLMLERGSFSRFLEHLPLPVRHAYLIVAVMVGWVLFRSPSLRYAGSMIGALFGTQGWDDPVFPLAQYGDPFMGLVMLAGALCAFPWTGLRQPGRPRNIAALVFHAVSPLLLLVVSAAFIAGQTHLSFIYFRF
jgi:alginate O-acetyltransferase complex protein AlgI